MPMEKIVKMSPEFKRAICKLIGDWNDVRVALFECDGVLLYFKEYGKQQKIRYELLNC